MKVSSAEFIKSATAPEHYPRDKRLEIAFMGRSNVGKSSLINSLLGVKGLARTSSTPGRTQLINFFLINQAFYFVDLPGYGYARVPVAIKSEWGPMIETYLASRETLVLSIAIIDARHGPTKLDLQLKDWLESNQQKFIVVATKADKLSNNQLRASLKSSEELFGEHKVIPYSAITRRGAERIWKEIATRIL
jgi:GTP-binding protein